MDLTPPQLLRLVAVLELSKDLILDVARGKSITREDIRLVRGGLSNVRDIVKALDEQTAWDSPSMSPSASESPSVSPSSSMSPSASPSASPSPSA